MKRCSKCGQILPLEMIPGSKPCFSSPEEQEKFFEDFSGRIRPALMELDERQRQSLEAAFQEWIDWMRGS